MCSVSVVVPCYNSSQTIDRCLSSIVCQTMPPNEIVLIIDKSDDLKDTLKIIQRHIISHPRIKITVKVPETRQGVSASRNIGWDISASKYIAFIDSDVAWTPEKIEIQVSVME